MNRIPEQNPVRNRARSRMGLSPEGEKPVTTIFGKNYRRLSRKMALSLAGAANYAVREKATLYRAMKETGTLALWEAYLDEFLPKHKGEILKVLYSLELSDDDLLALSQDLIRETRSGRWLANEKRYFLASEAAQGYEVAFCGDRMILSCGGDFRVKGSIDYLLAIEEKLERDGQVPHPRTQADELFCLYGLVDDANQSLAKAIYYINKKESNLPLTQEEKDTWLAFAEPATLELRSFFDFLFARQKEALDNEKYWEVEDE